MAKEIKINIPDFKEVVDILKNRIKKLFSWCVLHLKKSFKIVLFDEDKRRWGLIVLILSFGVLFFWSLSSALLWLLFLLFLVYQWENRIIATFALILLASCPFLLAFKKEDLAETMAVYAYFFLVMTVVLQIVEYIRDQRNEKK